MKNSYKVAFSLLLSLIIVTPALAYQHKHSTRTSRTWKSSVVKAITTPVVTVVAPVVAPVLAPKVAGETRMSAYLTAYGWSDNTPAGAAISHPVIHSAASGEGTFSDPITMAVGHSIISGIDILDYPAGTRVYVPNLRKYFIAEDTCGDGSEPQNGPCHTGSQGHVWLDIWVGGQGQSSAGTSACENAVTDVHAVIVNPASNYKVVAGAVFNGSCAEQFGDVVVIQ